MIFLLLISLYTSREVMILLVIENYGIYQVIAGFVFLFVFLSFSKSNATQRFLSFELGKEDNANLRRVFSRSLCIYAILAICLFVIDEPIGFWFLQNKLVIPQNRQHAAFWVYQLSLILIVLQTCQTPFNALLIARKKMEFYILLFSFIEIILKLAILVILGYVPADKLIVYGLLMTTTTVCIVSLYVAFCYRRYLMY